MRKRMPPWERAALPFLSGQIFRGYLLISQFKKERYEKKKPSASAGRRIFPLLFPGLDIQVGINIQCV